jgi:hypothetical protein
MSGVVGESWRVCMVSISVEYGDVGVRVKGV